MYGYARTKTASTINLHDAYEDLCFRWNQQVATALAKKLGWKPEYSNLEFVARDPVSRRNYVKGHLVDDQRVQVSGEIGGHYLDRAGTLRAIDSDAVAEEVFWIVKEHGDDTRTAHTARRASSMDALQRRVDEAFDQVTSLLEDIKRDGPDIAKENKLERARAAWNRALQQLDAAILQEVDSISFDDDSLRYAHLSK